LRGDLNSPACEVVHRRPGEVAAGHCARQDVEGGLQLRAEGEGGAAMAPATGEIEAAAADDIRFDAADKFLPDGLSRADGFTTLSADGIGAALDLAHEPSFVVDFVASAESATDRPKRSAPALLGAARPIQPSGRMFWFMWKKLVGSYFVLTSCNRR
jgi:hypothetical protein